MRTFSDCGKDRFIYYSEGCFDLQVKFFCFLGLNADGPKAKSLQPLTFSRLLCIFKRKLPVGWFPNGQQTPGKAEKAGPSAGREHICGYGGIGRRAGFRFQWATVWVQIPLPVPTWMSPAFRTILSKSRALILEKP